MMEVNRRPRFRVRLRTLLLVVAILALLLVIVIQQVQISRQQVQIRQMRTLVDRYLTDTDKLTVLIRDLRDRIDRHRVARSCRRLRGRVASTHESRRCFLRDTRTVNADHCARRRSGMWARREFPDSMGKCVLPPTQMATSRRVGTEP